ncbi:phage adaptor protein [Aquipseudomonas campi]
MAYETVSDLIKAFREDEQDEETPYFWGDKQLLRFVNGALAAFAEKTKAIIDDGLEIDFGDGEAVVPYSQAIIEVLDAELVVDGKSWPLAVRSPGAIKRSLMPKAGRVVFLIADNATGSLRMLPAPKRSGMLLLQVIRRPLKEVSKDDRIPDVSPMDREYLLLHMKHRAYNVADSEIFDPSKARAFLAEFDSECQRIYEDSLRRRNAARTIRYQG